MAGIIRREDIDEVRQRADLKEVVEAHVTLKPAGVGSWKGLCPFHDERSPSFTVKPQAGFYHCFGCEENGDVFSFLQKMEHLSFSEAVQKLADRTGVQLRFEEGSGPARSGAQPGERHRLVAVNKAAAEFYASQLGTEEAAAARSFLTERGFGPEDARTYGLGYAPRGWDNLLRHLRGRGFPESEIQRAGLVSQGNRGVYDRFRGRLLWPIRDTAGDVLGFGARKLYDDDPGPKYLNTPETPLYKKSQVLYGLDVAKRAVGSQRRLVVVEGYTDVMACHKAGVDTAVATCGTAFGVEHIKVARRLISDDGSGGEVVFTFDGDAAGQKAAMRAFSEDQRFVAQTYVAVDPEGMDPCDIRLKRGDAAVRELIAHKRPLFEFSLRTVVEGFPLATVEGRVAAARAAAPILAGIKDPAIRPAYVREVAGWLGMDIAAVEREMRSVRAKPGAGGRAGRSDGAARPNGPARPESAARTDASREPAGEQPEAGHAEGAPFEAPGRFFPRPDPADPVARVEREALEVLIQQPLEVTAEEFDSFALTEFVNPAYAEVAAAMRASAGLRGRPSLWMESIREHTPRELWPLLGELVAEQLPAGTPEEMAGYVHAIMGRLAELELDRARADLLGRLQRATTHEEAQGIQRELLELEAELRRLRGDR